MSRETAAGKQFHTDDAELPWVYARTSDSGGIFGLRQDSMMTVFRSDLVSVAYAPHTYRVMPKCIITSELETVEYVTSYGDGTSHGATWQHFKQLLEPLSPEHFQELDERSVELCLDGLQNMALEGAHRHGGGWRTISQGLAEAYSDLLDGKGYLQRPLYEGLGWLATNFAEREAIDSRSSAVSSPQ